MRTEVELKTSALVKESKSSKRVGWISKDFASSALVPKLKKQVVDGTKLKRQPVETGPKVELVYSPNNRGSLAAYEATYIVECEECGDTRFRN
jgi:hypothetical protein